jgi:hypothetical protein
MIGNAIAGIFGTGVAASTTAYESIATSTVGAGGTATITFSSIPSTYTHLQVRFIAKNAGTGSADDFFANFSFNSDTTYTNYRSHYLNGNGASAFASSIQSAGNYALLGDSINSGTGTTSIFAGGVIDVLDYANTNKYKTGRSLVGNDRNGSGNIYLTSALWLNTAAINRIDITCSGGNFTQYSQFALYGIKG